MFEVKLDFDERLTMETHRGFSVSVEIRNQDERDTEYSQVLSSTLKSVLGAILGKPDLTQNDLVITRKPGSFMRIHKQVFLKK